MHSICEVKFRLVAARVRALKVEGEEPAQDLFVAEVARPAVSVEHGVVESVVRQVEPGRLGVVQGGERAALPARDERGHIEM